MNLGSTILEMSCSNERMAGFGEWKTVCTPKPVLVFFCKRFLVLEDRFQQARQWVGVA